MSPQAKLNNYKKDLESIKEVLPDDMSMCLNLLREKRKSFVDPDGHIDVKKVIEELCQMKER